MNPGLSKKVSSYVNSCQDWILSVIFLMGFPLLPLLLERLIDHHLKDSSLAITAAVYAICTGTASSVKVVFGLSILASFLGSAAYGVAEAAPAETWPEIAPFALVAIAFFSVTVIIERFFKHVLKQNPFFEFKN